MLRFDESKLQEHLSRLSPPKIVAFSAACAERLKQTYAIYATQEKVPPDVVDRALDLVWNNLLVSQPGGRLGAAAAELEAMIPDEDAEDWTLERSLASDALTATVYSLECAATFDPEKAAGAARHAYEALDYYVTSRNAPSSDDWSEDQILSHPIIQAELARQADDICALESVSDGALKTRIEEIRDRNARVDIFASGPSSR